MKEKVKVQLKLQDIYSRKQLETIKKIDRNNKLCGRTPFQRTNRKFWERLWELESKSTKNEFKKKAE